MITWRSLPYDKSKELVVGTYLSIGFVDGAGHRFGIYERRTRVWDDTDKKHYPSVAYDIRDAESSSNEDIRNCKLPKVVFRSNDPAECERWIIKEISNV